jgi:hypothetical protein
MELLDVGEVVYLLYEDGTEAAAFDAEEIANHDGLFGIETADWLNSEEYAALKAAAENGEAAKESALIYGDTPMFGIYQVKGGDEYRDFRFQSSEELYGRGFEVDRANYELVYTAPLNAGDTSDKIYARFQDDRPADFPGHSLTMGDVLVFQKCGDVQSRYVDKAGFTALEAFLGNETPSVIVIDTMIPTVADLEAAVKRGETISLMDLANAGHQDRASAKTPTPKVEAKAKKPTLLSRVAEFKRQIDAGEVNKIAPAKDKGGQEHG